MTPTLPSSKPSAGLNPLQQANETVAQYQRFGLTPSFSIKTPPSSPTTAITSNVTTGDVERQRQAYETQQTGALQADETLTSLDSNIKGMNPSPFSNPQSFIENTLYGERDLSSAEQMQQEGLNTIADTTSNFFANRDQQIQGNYDKTGVFDAQGQLAGTKTKIAKRQARLREDLKKMETDSAARGMSRDFYNNNRQKLEMDAEFELANLSIIEAAQTGNLTEARSLAEDLTDRQYESFQGQIQSYQSQLDTLIPTLNAEQEQRANQMKVALDLYSQQIEQNRQDTLERRKLMADVAGEGAPDGVINAVMGARTLEEAYKAASPYIGLQSRLEFQNRMAQQRFGNLIDLAKLGQKEAIMRLGLTLDSGEDATDDELAYAAQYAATGTIPPGLKSAGVTFGRVAELARDIPKADGTVVNAATGVKDSKIPAAQQDDISRLYNIIKLTDELIELDKQRAGGVIGGTVGKVVGSEVQNDYLTKRKAIVDEIARMQTGAALTIEEQVFYSDYLPGRFSEPLFFGVDSGSKIDAFKDIMQTKLDGTLKNNSLSIYGYSKVKYNDMDFIVGQIITNEQGEKGIVTPNGDISIMK